MEIIKYRSSDIWLLQSIIFSGEKGASLFDIISIGDGLNHSIFTTSELENGFSRLTTGGLIFEKESLFFPTIKASEIYQEVARRKGGIYKIRERLEKKLNASNDDPIGKYPSPNDDLKYPGFSPKAVRDAIDQWHKEARKLMK